MIDLTRHKDPDAARVLRNACKPNANPPGTYIAYFEGDYASNVGYTAVGRAAYELQLQRVVRLFQKKLQDEPRRYIYLAQVV